MSKYKFIDIGANLTDSMFRGVYRSKKSHVDDFSDVLKRGYDAGLDKLIITGGNVEESTEALELSKCDERLYCTVGCHPTRCDEFEKNGATDYFNQLLAIAKNGSADQKVVAIGECGLDYDRLNFCKKDVQKKYFEYQFDLAEELKLPMFLHCRNSHDDFLEIMGRNRNRISGGVVHSFDGTSEQAQKIIDMDLYIGINGCSLKTDENLEMVASLPPASIMLETDCPWCDIRPTHASSKFVKTKTEFAAKKKERWAEGCQVKGRNEPCNIVQVLEVIAGVQNLDPIELSEIIYNNTNKLFFPTS